MVDRLEPAARVHRPLADRDESVAPVGRTVGCVDPSQWLGWIKRLRILFAPLVKSSTVAAFGLSSFYWPTAPGCSWAPAGSGCSSLQVERRMPLRDPAHFQVPLLGGLDLLLKVDPIQVVDIGVEGDPHHMQTGA